MSATSSFLSVSHGVIMTASSRQSSKGEWRNCTFMHSMRSSPSLPRSFITGSMAVPSPVSTCPVQTFSFVAVQDCQCSLTVLDCQRSLGFVCVPVDFKHRVSNGLAFINLLSLHQSNFEDVLFSTTGRACQDVRVVYAIERAGTRLDDNVMRYVDAVPQRYNLSMCAFKVLSSCPRDVSYRRQAAEKLHFFADRPQRGSFRWLGYWSDTSCQHIIYIRTQTRPATEFRGGSASKVSLPRVFFPRVRLH